MARQSNHPWLPAQRPEPSLQPSHDPAPRRHAADRLRAAALAPCWLLPLAVLAQGSGTPMAPVNVAQVLIADASAAPLAGARGRIVYLDVVLNGQPRGLVQFGLRGQELWASAAALRQLGFVLAPGLSDPVRLADLPGLQVQFDSASQRVQLQASLALLDLPTTTLGPREQAGPAASASPGLLLNYDLYATQGRGASTGLHAFTELRAFSGQSVFSTTALAQQARQSGQGWSGHAVRLDSTWSRSLPDQMVTLRLGDTLTSALPWSRATRIGGIQLARNFALQPYRSTAPIPAFMGEATTPSQVELFVNGMRQYSGQVPAGPFQLNTLPSVNSSGSAQVVVTDSFGRATTLNFALFDSRQLLAPGLSDWSIDLGVVRQGYGLRSHDYGRELAASGVWRYGLSSSVTLESHAEASQGVALAGAGAAWQLGPWGLLSGALASSQHRAGSGSQFNAGYHWQRQGWYAGADWTQTQGDYRDVASRYGAPPPRRSGRAFAGLSTQHAGSFGLSYVDLRPHGQDTMRYASATWFKSLGSAATLSLSFNQNLQQSRERSLFLGLSLALDGGTSLAGGVQRSHNQTVFSADAQRGSPSAGGLGWRVSSRSGAGQSGAQGELQYLGRYGRVAGGASVYGDSRYAYANATGSLVFMGGSAFAARQIHDGFAVVSTDGVAQVPVRLENRPIGRTDASGLLLVTPLHAYQTNRLAIDTLDLPPDLRIEQVQQQASPTDRAGTLVRFAITPVRAASITLVDAGGQPLALGSQVQLVGQSATAVVGFDGVVYLDTLAAGNLLQVHTPSGACQVALQHPGTPGTVATIGPLTCQAVPRKEKP